MGVNTYGTNPGYCAAPNQFPAFAPPPAQPPPYINYPPAQPPPFAVNQQQTVVVSPPRVSQKCRTLFIICALIVSVVILDI